MALILDLAVLAIAAVVIGSLALLTWTLAVSSAHSVRRGRAQVALARAAVGDAEDRIREIGEGSRQATRDLANRGEADEDGEQTDA